MFFRLLPAVAMALPLVADADHKDHKACPMIPSGAQPTAVDQRHDQATHVAHEDSVHHFLLRPDGGVIRLEVKDAANDEGRGRVRQHLRQIARAFSAADFSVPMFVHDQTPPGVDVMKARSSSIRYRYAATRRGGEVRITTPDAEALSAIHAFLRFQIEDHRTGDPTTFD
jgi:hypothetical protein